MFMSTTLAHYQLPLFGVASSALLTEIGADQRSVFMRPITTDGFKTELPQAMVVHGVEKVSVPLEFTQWLRSVQQYQAKAELGKRAEAQAASPEPAFQEPAPSEPAMAGPEQSQSDPGQPAPTGHAQAQAQAEAEPAPAEPEPPQAEEPAVATAPGSSGSGRGGGLLSAILGR